MAGWLLPLIAAAVFFSFNRTSPLAFAVQPNRAVC